MAVSDQLSPYSLLRREIAERLISFFAGSGDGKSASLDAGAAIATTQGPHRERNEDKCAVVRFRFGSMRADLRLAILCDGMGGMARGGDAAALAIGSFIASFATIEPDCELRDRLHRACQFANSSVFNAFYGDAGTTLTAIAFGVSARWAIHVGDSRLYGLDHLREIDLLTKDDTVSGAVNAHLGSSDEDELDNRLLQFVGIGDPLEPHLIDVSNDWRHDLWLLTSDGAHSVGRKVLSGVCEGSKSPLDLVRKLIFVSEAINTQDNATAICIRSGHVKSNDEEHEGLTIQVTGPDRNLDIWLPPSVIKLTHLERVTPSVREELLQSDRSRDLSKTVRARKPRVPRKPKASKKVAVKTDKELPLGVIFEINSGDD